MSPTRVLIEACCGSVEEALAAQNAGAARIELCAALPTGGVTPSAGMLEEARVALSIPIVAMVRPREGGACPPHVDFLAAVRDVAHCFRFGADEVICGVLDQDGQIDKVRNDMFIEAAEGRPLAFHRVFDMTPDLNESLETLINLGFRRVLTSGCSGTVDDGFNGLKGLVEQAGDRITVLPGGGVRPSNVLHIVEHCGCKEIHFSFRKETMLPAYGGVPDFEPLPERIRTVRTILEQASR